MTSDHTANSSSNPDIEKKPLNGSTRLVEHHADAATLKAIADAHSVVSHTEGETIFIRNAKGDPDSPRSWPNWKRYGIVILASWLNNLVRPNSYHHAFGLLSSGFGAA